MKNTSNKQLSNRTNLLMQRFFAIYAKKIKNIRLQQESLKKTILNRKIKNSN